MKKIIFLAVYASVQCTDEFPRDRYGCSSTKVLRDFKQIFRYDLKSIV